MQQGQIKRLEFQARRYRDMANAYDDPKQAKRAKYASCYPKAHR